MARGRIRKFINDIHLWFGLASGIILFLVCLSGTVYTFRAEVEQWLNRKIYMVETADGTPVKPVQQLINAVEQERKATVSGITIPVEKNKAWSFSLKPAGKEKGKGKTVLVNPYTGKITGDTDTGSSKFFGVMMRLHRWLLMEQTTGRIIVGIATIIFVSLLISGIILWLPRRMRYIRQGFIILFSGKWKRINHDLHNVLGFYSFIFLLIMGLTGLCWSFEWYKDGASKLLGAEVFGGRKEKPVKSVANGASMLDVDKVISLAGQQLNYTGTTRIAFPADSSGSFSITKVDVAKRNTAAGDKVIIDAYDGAILKTELFSNKSTGQKIAATIRPIHTGEIYGLFSKIIYFICCLIATSLPVTGTIIWLNKMKKKPKGKNGKVLGAAKKGAVSV